jgi:hypothetical protein
MAIIRAGQEGSILQDVNEVVIIERSPSPAVQGDTTNGVGLICQNSRISDEIEVCSSLTDYAQKCGDYVNPDMDGYLTVKNLFDAGAGEVHVWSATSGDIGYASVTISGSPLSVSASGSILKLTAKKGGTHDNNAKLYLTPATVADYFNVTLQNGQEQLTYNKVSTNVSDTRYIKKLIDRDASSFVDVLMYKTDGSYPITGTYSFTGGTNGTVTGAALPDAAYTGTESGGVRTGIQKFKETDEVVMVISARNSTPINNALIAHVDDLSLSPRRTIISNPAGTSLAAAITSMDIIDDDKVQMVFPNVKVANPFTLETETVSPVPFKAGLDCLLSYEQSAAMLKLPATVTGSEFPLTNNEIQRLAEKRIVPIRKVRGIGIIYEKDITTSSNPEWEAQSTRKAKDYLGMSIEDGLRPYVSKPITPALWRNIKVAISTFLDLEARAGRIGKSDGSTPFSVSVPVSKNTPAIVRSKRVIVEVEVSLLGHADKILVYFNSGVDNTIVTTN